MRLLLILPLSRFYVQYWVASGRPFSSLDRLMLRAIGNTHQATLEDLHMIFRLPRRLLVEVLVTLFGEGWISFDQEGRFALTTFGEKALTSNETPRAIHTRQKSTTIWVDGYSGNLFSGRLAYSSYSDLNRERLWDVGYKVPVRVGSGNLDRGLVHRLLPRPKDHWIHSVMDPEPRSLNGLYLPIGVDLDGDTVAGLPDRWRRRLGSELLEEAARAPARYRDPEVRSNYFLAEAETEGDRDSEFHDDIRADLLISLDQHLDAICMMLSKADEGDAVLIASSVLDFDSLHGPLAVPVAAALARGVNIDLLWGRLSGVSPRDHWRDVQAVVQSRLKNLLSSKPFAGCRGILRLNPAPSRSNARMAMWVNRRGSETCHAIVGSFDWLNVGSYNNSNLHAGAMVEHAGIAAELSQHGAALIASGPGNELSGCMDRWRSIAGDLESAFFRQAALSERPAGKLRARVLRDHQHEAALIDLALEATPLALLSPGAGAVENIPSWLKRKTNEINVFSHETCPEWCRLNWTQREGLFARGACRSDAALVTSFNPLVVSGVDSDIGLLLSGPDAGRPLIEAIR